MLVKVENRDKPHSTSASDAKKFKQSFAKLNQRLRKGAVTKK